MSDLFGSNRENEQRDDGSPRIIFANLRRPSRPILLEKGYKVFTGTASFLWFLLVVVVWVFRVEIRVSRELISSIAGSSVELAGLSLTLLGILHEFNKKDKWFKVGLLLVAFLFGYATFSGFLLAMTWLPIYDASQQITIVLVGILAISFFIQIDWKIFQKYIRINWFRNIKIPIGFDKTQKRAKLIFPFVLPLFIIWFPRINSLTSTLIVFAGALITLLTLMGITTFYLFKSPDEENKEDPFINTLRNRYEKEILAIQRIGIIKDAVLKVVQNIQNEKQGEISDDKSMPSMIPEKVVVSRLREIGFLDNSQLFESVFRSLVDEKILCRYGYSGGYWTVPTEQQIQNVCENINELAIIQTYKTGRDHNGFEIEGFAFEKLRAWFAHKCLIPEYVTGEYIMPRIYSLMRNGEKFHKFFGNRNMQICFVNLSWKLPEGFWTRALDISKYLSVKEYLEWKRYISKSPSKRFSYDELINYVNQYLRQN